MVGATRALAREHGRYGITVNCVSPGALPAAAEAIHLDPEGYNAMVRVVHELNHPFTAPTAMPDTMRRWNTT
jgi:NAD(P)-dependent dehydrogenase (short-subunit alcohol dehydrogenase family)